MKHRESWAEEAVAPTKEQYLSSADSAAAASTGSASSAVNSAAALRAPKRTILQPQAKPVGRKIEPVSTDALVVVSRVKELIRAQAGFNTSQCCIDALTQQVAAACLKGIAQAEAAGRKTVMGRDIDCSDCQKD